MLCGCRPGTLTTDDRARRRSRVFCPCPGSPRLPRLLPSQEESCPRTGSHLTRPEQPPGGSSSVCTARDRAFAPCGTPSEIALDRGWDLEIVTAWPDADDPLIHDVPGRYITARGHAVECQREALATLDPVVAADIETFLVNARPAEALIARCDDTDLLVVGAGQPEQERVRRSVGAECAESAASPVTVVPDPDAKPVVESETHATCRAIRRQGHPLALAGHAPRHQQNVLLAVVTLGSGCRAASSRCAEGEPNGEEVR